MGLRNQRERERERERERVRERERERERERGFRQHSLQACSIVFQSPVVLTEVSFRLATAHHTTPWAEHEPIAK